jgi:hypothetical protein
MLGKLALLLPVAAVTGEWLVFLLLWDLFGFEFKIAIQELCLDGERIRTLILHHSRTF